MFSSGGVNRNVDEYKVASFSSLLWAEFHVDVLSWYLAS